MDLPDDPLGMGPPERGVFDWLVPDAGEGAESRALPPGPLTGHPGAPPVRVLQFNCRWGAQVAGRLKGARRSGKAPASALSFPPSFRAPNLRGVL